MGPLDEAEGKEAAANALAERWAKTLARPDDRVLTPPGLDLRPLVEDILARARMQKVIIFDALDGSTRVLATGHWGRLNRIGVQYPFPEPQMHDKPEKPWYRSKTSWIRQRSRISDKYLRDSSTFKEERDAWARREILSHGAREVRGVHLIESSTRETLDKGNYETTVRLDLYIVLDGDRTLSCLSAPSPSTLPERMPYLVKACRRWLERQSADSSDPAVGPSSP